MAASDIIHPLKSVLKKDEVYTITNCGITRFSNLMIFNGDPENETIETTTAKITEQLLGFCDTDNPQDNVMLIDVEPSSGGKSIVTYFNATVTEALLQACDTDAQDYGVVLLGVKFVCIGEVTSETGVIYSDV